jgi:hypothetical protein
MSGVDPETADSAVEQILSAYKDCVRVLGRDLLAEIPASQQGVRKARYEDQSRRTEGTEATLGNRAVNLAGENSATRLRL